MSEIGRRVGRPRAVIFDMDGLMLDTERLAPAAWRTAVDTLGLDFDMGLLPAMVGRNAADCRALVIDRHGPRFPIDDLLHAWAVAYDAIIERDGIDLKPGLLDLLTWLEREAIPKSVATSTRRDRAQTKLAQTGIVERFVALTGGDEIARGKPAPDIFLLAAQRMGYLPVDIVVLEDSEPGVRAALAAGMTPIMVPDLAPPSAEILAQGVLVLESLAQVPERLGGR
ncbi:MAG: HAD family phosphatase [Burkholderiales bacterium]|nr:HAD family phosphatase [Burkholderiales bacterium]